MLGTHNNTTTPYSKDQGFSQHGKNPISPKKEAPVTPSPTEPGRAMKWQSVLCVAGVSLLSRIHPYVGIAAGVASLLGMLYSRHCQKNTPESNHLAQDKQTHKPESNDTGLISKEIDMNEAILRAISTKGRQKKNLVEKKYIHEKKMREVAYNRSCHEVRLGDPWSAKASLENLRMNYDYDLKILEELHRRMQQQIDNETEQRKKAEGIRHSKVFNPLYASYGREMEQLDRQLSKGLMSKGEYAKAYAQFRRAYYHDKTGATYSPQAYASAIKSVFDAAAKAISDKGLADNAKRSPHKNQEVPVQPASNKEARRQPLLQATEQTLFTRQESLNLGGYVNGDNQPCYNLNTQVNQSQNQFEGELSAAPYRPMEKARVMPSEPTLVAQTALSPLVDALQTISAPQTNQAHYQLIPGTGARATMASAVVYQSKAQPDSPVTEPVVDPAIDPVIEPAMEKKPSHQGLSSFAFQGTDNFDQSARDADLKRFMEMPEEDEDDTPYSAAAPRVPVQPAPARTEEAIPRESAPTRTPQSAGIGEELAALRNRNHVSSRAEAINQKISASASRLAHGAKVTALRTGEQSLIQEDSRLSETDENTLAQLQGKLEAMEATLQDHLTKLQQHIAQQELELEEAKNSHIRGHNANEQGYENTQKVLTALNTAADADDSGGEIADKRLQLQHHITQRAVYQQMAMEIDQDTEQYNANLKQEKELQARLSEVRSRLKQLQ